METQTRDYAHVYKTIQKSLKEYLDTYGIKNVVLGISGGIDSTVVAAVVHGIEGVNLIGVSLPCSTNKSDEISTASMVGAEFCNHFTEHSIQDAFVTMEKHCEEISGHPSTPISQGNIKARLRMIALYDIASKYNGIVLDTDNKTEHLLGFFTINGDCTDLSPIANLWKTEVYEFAKWLLDNVYKESKALKSSISLIPTDGNGVSNSDLDQIAPNCTYFDVDKILKLWTNLHPMCVILSPTSLISTWARRVSFQNSSRITVATSLRECASETKEASSREPTVHMLLTLTWNEYWTATERHSKISNRIKKKHQADLS